MSEDHRAVCSFQTLISVPGGASMAVEKIGIMCAIYTLVLLKHREMERVCVATKSLHFHPNVMSETMAALNSK